MSTAPTFAPRWQVSFATFVEQTQTAAFGYLTCERRWGSNLPTSRPVGTRSLIDGSRMSSVRPSLSATAASAKCVASLQVTLITSEEQVQMPPICNCFVGPATTQKLSNQWCAQHQR